MSSHTEDTSFRLSGKLRVMTPLPITSAARKQLLYLESFSLSQSDAGHYTERSKSNTYLMLYTYAGKGILSYEGREFHLQAGDGFPKAFSGNAVISILTDTLLTRFFLRSLKTEMLFFTADPVIRHDWKNSFKVISGFSRIVI